MMPSNPLVENLPEQIEMPVYKCHKVVHALAIRALTTNPNGSIQLFFIDNRFAPLNIESEFATRFQAFDEADCGYYVVYVDGYQSWSPTKPFIDGYTPLEEAIQDIARVAHEANRAYCEALGDNSQLAWEDAPDWQRDSVVSGVEFHLNNPMASAGASHNNWMKDKIDAGWTWGNAKNEDLKTHPCLVPFLELPTAQQAKDFIFRAIVHALR